MQSMLIPELEPYRNVTDKYESLMTFLVHDITVKELNDKLYHRLNMIKTIKNTFKRKYINDRLYNFIEYFKEYDLNTIINAIFLVSTEIIDIPLNEKYMSIIKEYDINNFIIKYNNNFEINYINDLLTNLNFRTILHLNNTKLEHIILNNTKRKVIHTEDSKDMNLIKYMQDTQITKRCMIHGISGQLKNFKSVDHFVINKHLTDEQILEMFDNYDMTVLHNKLTEVMSYMSNEKMTDKLLIGKELQTGIKDYQVKTLFCTPKMYEKLTSVFPKEYLNFEIIQVRSLEIGDVVDTLDKNYKGIIGVKYY